MSCDSRYTVIVPVYIGCIGPSCDPEVPLGRQDHFPGGSVKSVSLSASSSFCRPSGAREGGSEPADGSSIGHSASLISNALQLILRFRVFEPVDFIKNTLGAGIGYVI